MDSRKINIPVVLWSRSVEAFARCGNVATAFVCLEDESEAAVRCAVYFKSSQRTRRKFRMARQTDSSLTEKKDTRIPGMWANLLRAIRKNRKKG